MSSDPTEAEPAFLEIAEKMKDADVIIWTFGYADEETTEDSCRVLAGKINRALEDGYVPAKESAYLDRACLSPLNRGEDFEVNGPAAKKDGDKTILVITGNRISEDPAGASIVESIKKYSRNKVELIELEDQYVKQ